ncbi:uncharacterized protein BO72DRAFT_196971 [Aspergillus fijiensis CBS 313.89]|uniref:Uncharacterized protein n=1 Tax=Aspergillus fijiensis CBS 313.89 TaxID=1448319 RepID=A0A8G1RM25_9EURO|nr:uncharacterized protein BO72DRAFT_196971 [Aspergillus fijiensis CBS 313.89]RAK74633.1 hypothetical protein BO72DRAFT_196971 [Aspergillus fijiensis CBS 313.89]
MEVGIYDDRSHSRNFPAIITTNALAHPYSCLISLLIIYNRRDLFCLRPESLRATHNLGWPCLITKATPYAGH